MKFIKLLKKIKSYSDHPMYKMSCVIADKNQVISIGFNKYKTHPKSLHPWGFIHAELAAILDNKFADLKGCTAYIYRETRDGKPAMAKPCPTCMETLKLAGIKKVVYTYNNGHKEENI